MTIIRHGTTAPVVTTRPARVWSASQLYALIVGAVSIAFGVIALARLDADFGHLTRGLTTVLGFSANPLLGLTEIGFGVLLMLAAIGPVIGRGLLALTGAAALGVGLVVLAGWWNGRLQRWLAATNRDGWLFVAVGGATVLVALLAPVWAVGGRRAAATTNAEDL